MDKQQETLIYQLIIQESDCNLYSQTRRDIIIQRLDLMPWPIMPLGPVIVRWECNLCLQMSLETIQLPLAPMRYTNNTATSFENYNVALGYEALRGSTNASNNTGNYNTALGYWTLRNTLHRISSTRCGKIVERYGSRIFGYYQIRK